MFRTVTVVVAALVVTAGAGSGWSRTRVQTENRPNGVVLTRVTVPYGDLDLTRAEGADALLRRVAHAASRACGGAPGSGVNAMAEARNYRACTAKAVARAVAQLDDPMVRQRYAARQAAEPVKVAEAHP